MADNKDDKATPDKGTPPAPPKAKKQKVRVLVNNLGHKLLQAGTITDDPEYVAVLEQDGQRLVEAV